MVRFNLELFDKLLLTGLTVNALIYSNILYNQNYYIKKLKNKYLTSD
jgi:hypothetical protein